MTDASAFRLGEPRSHTPESNSACAGLFADKVSMGNPHFVIFVEDMG